jgi:dihydropteroate synthase
MAELIAKTGVMVVLMYSKDKTARTTRDPKKYKDVVATVKTFLKTRIAFALNAGIKKSQIIIDPGMGAFVSGEPKYSFEILERLGEFRSLGFPILVGVSRKSLLGGKVGERGLKSAMASALAAKNGADIIRVHDVGETRGLTALLT